jgi:hypothetical protein
MVACSLTLGMPTICASIMHGVPDYLIKLQCCHLISLIIFISLPVYL